MTNFSDTFFLFFSQTISDSSRRAHNTPRAITSNTVHLSTPERWFSAKWSWFVATYEARHQPGQARGDGSLGPVSRADHPVATWYNRRYTARSTSRRLRFRLGTIYTSLRVREKHALCASILLPPPPTWRDARRFLSNESSNVHPPYAAHNSSANDFHRTELYRLAEFSLGIRLNPIRLVFSRRWMMDRYVVGIIIKFVVENWFNSILIWYARRNSYRIHTGYARMIRRQWKLGCVQRVWNL